jgi:hypothetical protein
MATTIADDHGFDVRIEEQSARRRLRDNVSAFFTGSVYARVSGCVKEWCEPTAQARCPLEQKRRARGDKRTRHVSERCEPRTDFPFCGSRRDMVPFRGMKLHI